MKHRLARVVSRYQLNSNYSVMADQRRIEVLTDAFSGQKQVQLQSIFGFLAKKTRHLTFKSDQLVYRLKIAENAPKTLQIFKNYLGPACHQTPLANWGLWPSVSYWTATNRILAKSLTGNEVGV